MNSRRAPQVAIAADDGSFIVAWDVGQQIAGARISASGQPMQSFSTAASDPLRAAVGALPTGEFVDRGMHTLKGVPHQWHLFCMTR